jgi:hypothetical protein
MWVLVFGIIASAQEGRGALGTIGALGQEVKRPPVRNEPAPRLPDGTISLDGLWVGGGPVNDIGQGLPKGEKLPLNAKGQEVLADRAKHETDDPHLWCMPMGVPRSTPYPFRFVQDITGSQRHRTCSSSRGEHPQLPADLHGRPQASGGARPDVVRHSIGRWENKDTLVIDTVGFNDKFWFDRKGTPHSEQLHTIETWTRPNMGTLVNTVTIEDPDVLHEAVHVTFTARLQAPGDETHGIHLPGEQSVRPRRRAREPVLQK